MDSPSACTFDSSLEKEIPKNIFKNLIKGKFFLPNTLRMFESKLSSIGNTTTAEKVLATSNVTLKSFKLSEEDVELVKSAAAKKYGQAPMTGEDCPLNDHRFNK